MFTVALIGPDGAGKTTIGRRLEHELPLPVKYIYMGINTAASNHMLPTTRLVRAAKRAFGADRDQGGPRDPTAPHRKKGGVRCIGASIKSTLSLFNRLAEECYRQILAWHYTRRRNIVIFDRHYYPDYYAYHIAGDGGKKSLAQRIHGFFLSRIYPQPHLMIYLDAPAEVLWARKREGTLELLERRRLDYLRVGDVVKHFIVVNANRPEAEVAFEVQTAIDQFYRSRHEDCCAASPSVDRSVAATAARTEPL